MVLLLDYSRSFAPYSNGDLAALSEANKSILQMIRAGSLPQPFKILWAAFGDNGLEPLEPCGPARVFSQRLTGQNNRQNLTNPVASELLTNIGKLESWLSVCVSTVRAASQATQQFTDISGALAFAANAVDDISDGRVIVLFSDLLEDLPPNRQRPTFNLNKSKVLLIWRPGFDDQKQPAAVTQRVEDWSKKLTNAGASRVCAKAAQGLTEGEVSNCLWKSST